MRVQNPLLGTIQYLSSWITFELEFHSAASCLFALKLNSVFTVDWKIQWQKSLNQRVPLTSLKETGEEGGGMREKGETD